MRSIATLFLLIAFLPSFPQETSTPDSSRLLREVVVEAYETDRRLQDVPASVGVVQSQQLEKFSNTSILPAVNLIPGVRMEERSPGSYRFAIRGSSLRSPFGVRNVKAYWNGLPFTDGGGNTYLNLFDFGSIGSIEVIKGPGGSLYGAGTGGVILLKSPRIEQNLFQTDVVFGSYGLKRYLLRGQTHSDRVQANVQFGLHQSDGYREQTALERGTVNADVKLLTSRGALSATVIYSDLSYGTPGGLTRTEFEADPSQARPRTASLGAVEARAAVQNKTIFGGLIYEHDWNSRWTTNTGVYVGSSKFENPTVRNYESREETNLGARTTTEYAFSNGDRTQKIAFGGEYQDFFSPVNVYGNIGGKPDTVQVRDELTSRAGLIFAQADIELSRDLFVTAGASVNFLTYDYLSIEPAPVTAQTRTFETVVSPRLAILKKISEKVSVFASYSNGFSPPSLAEVRPSTNTFTKTLKAESGNSFETGARGTCIDDKLSYDLVVYDFALRNTIVVQRNEEGADYFVNAGKTSQRGMEAFVSYDFVKGKSLLSLFRLWGSYAYQHYRFKESDLAGNALTGIAPTVFSTGLDVNFLEGFSTNVTINYVDHIPLNDANTAFAESYVLVGVRAGYHTPFWKASRLRLFAGIDNALDEIYSLGNDLNAFGGRYYNAAMPRNYYAGLSIVLGAGN